MTSSTPRWGLLSTARINAHVLPALAGRVLAVASRDGARAARYAEANGIPRAYGDYDALLADPDVDAVYISLPNHLHADWAARAARAGKHALVEKPFSRSPAAVERAFDAAEERGLVLAEALMWRHHPQVAIAADLLSAGRIGALTGVVATHTAYLDDRRDHRMDPARHGGALMDVGCYAVSAVRTFAGEPERATAQAVRADGVDLRLVATMRCPDGVLATIDCGLDSAYRKRVELVGTRGRIVLNDPFAGDDDPAITVHTSEGSTRIPLAQTVSSYAREIAEFEAAVAGRHPPLLGREESVAQARALELLYTAAGTAT